MTPKLLPSAIADLERGREFYDLQEPGIGDYFVQRAFADVESLRLYGGIHGKKFGFPFVLVNRFPWVIYYQMEDGIPVVFRILDCRSSPDSHLKALTEG